MKKIFAIILLIIIILIIGQSFKMTDSFKVQGRVYEDSTAQMGTKNVQLTFVNNSGSEVVINSDSLGSFSDNLIADGNYLIKYGGIVSKTWHNIPSQGNCNNCHILGGDGNSIKNKIIPTSHTQVGVGNDCSPCHFYPQSMQYSQVRTRGILNLSVSHLSEPISNVKIKGKVYLFDPKQYNITSTRPDVFNIGFYSVFDVILAVAAKNNIKIEYVYDSTRKTHFITKIDTTAADYWYHFAYHSGEEQKQEITYRRANRWDELLWKPGTNIELVTGENLTEIMKEYLEEINREKQQGNIIPLVTFLIKPSKYRGNPTEAERDSFKLVFKDVKLTAHNLRASNANNPYKKPFKPGVITSIDILYSLKDQGKMDVVTSAYFDRINNNLIECFYVNEMSFPNVGKAHASGSHGFIYITENGSYTSLPNYADSKFDINADISVLHAQDFSYWRWAEFGNPYYEKIDPLSVEDKSISEDYNSISRGFNLHQPFPNPFRGNINISYNIFEPNKVSIEIYDIKGRMVKKIVDNTYKSIGIHKLSYQPNDLPAGTYFLQMTYGSSKQTRKILYSN